MLNHHHKFFIPSLQLENIWMQFLFSGRSSRRLQIDQKLIVPYKTTSCLHNNWDTPQVFGLKHSAQLFLKFRCLVNMKRRLQATLKCYTPDMNCLSLLKNRLFDNSPMQNHNISTDRSFSLKFKINYCIHAYQMFPQLKKSAYWVLPAKIKDC